MTHPSKRFLFAPDRNRTLGQLRFLLVHVILVLRAPRLLRALNGRAKIDEVFYHPTFFLRHLPLDWPYVESTNLLIVLSFSLVGLAAAWGIYTRWTLLIFTILYALVGSITSSFGWYNHATAIAFWVLVMLVIVPGTESFSVDAFWRESKRDRILHMTRSRWKRFRGRPTSRAGLLVVLALMSSLYFAAGFSKLRHGDGTWLTGETLSYYLHSERQLKGQFFGARKNDGVLTHYIYTSTTLPPGKVLAKFELLVRVSSWFSLCLELGFALVFIRRLRNVVIFAAIAFHLGILATMGISFTETFAILVGLFNLRPLADFIKRR